MESWSQFWSFWSLKRVGKSSVETWWDKVAEEGRDGEGVAAELISRVAKKGGGRTTRTTMEKKGRFFNRFQECNYTRLVFNTYIYLLQFDDRRFYDPIISPFKKL